MQRHRGSTVTTLRSELLSAREVWSVALLSLEGDLGKGIYSAEMELEYVCQMP
jgi:hypothetical protein